jgi:hypothetical protein
MPPKTKKNTINNPSKWKKVRSMLRQAKILDKNNPVEIETDLKKVMAKFNTTTYRTKYKRDQLHINSFVKTDGLLDKSSYFLMKSDSRKMFDQFKILSNPSDTGSDSLVIALIRGKQQFIMKITFVAQKKAIEFNAPDTEARLYKLMGILVSKNITPHVFMLADCFWESISRNELEPNFKKFLETYNKQNYTGKTHIYPILTETGDSEVKVTTFKDMLTKLRTHYCGNNIGYDQKGAKENNDASFVILNLLFQIFYTLQCFEEIGFKHNDCHFQNIMVLERKSNILNTSNFTSKINRSYEFKNASGELQIIKLPYIGLDVRIFDFDRSVKHKNKFRYFPEGIKSRFLRELHFTGTNALNNPHHDTFKVFATLINNYYYYNPHPIRDLLESLVTGQAARDILSSGFIKDPVTKKDTIYEPGRGYYLLQIKPPKDVLPTNAIVLTEIEKLLRLATHSKLVNKTKNLNVIEYFSINNVKLSDRDRILSKKAQQKPVVASPPDSPFPLPLHMSAPGPDFDSLFPPPPLVENKPKPKQPQNELFGIGELVEFKYKTSYNSIIKEHISGIVIKKTKEAYLIQRYNNSTKHILKKNIDKASIQRGVAPPKKAVSAPKKAAVAAKKKAAAKKSNNNIQCNDLNTKRSAKRTTYIVNGKERKGKLIDRNSKNCMFPFKHKVSQGKGKKKLEQMSDKCVTDSFGQWCATERNADCTAKKVGYCL